MCMLMPFVAIVRCWIEAIRAPLIQVLCAYNAAFHRICTQMKTWIAATIVLALGAPGLFWFAHHESNGALSRRGGFQMPPPTVEVTPVVLGTVERTVEAVGTLRANESVTIRPEIAGRVVAIGFNEGEKVTKGATLITLDDSVYRAEVAEKAANRKISELAYERAKLLVEKKAASVEVRDRAEAQLEADDAGLQLARARLDKTRILAPFDGVDRPAHRQRRRLRRRRSGARQSRRHRSAEGRFPRRRDLPAGRRGRTGHRRQSGCVSRRRRSTARCTRSSRKSTSTAAPS